ncbi:hypothetical protein [Elioraea thermophila]|uniref:hypothetical protein n=1 Tax=Elioraea thermophila TaxID=2185104 RepID=UPI001300B4DD|nr:hypothetical protein [Elioraea thermophila]
MPAAQRQDWPRGSRLRVWFVLALVLLGLVVAGAVWLGLDPPQPKPVAVEKVLPTERFAPR